MAWHKKIFGNTERLFSAVFLHCVSHHGLKIVIADDDLLRGGFIRYLEQRKVNAVDHPVRTGLYGFIVVPAVPQHIEELDASSVCVMSCSLRIGYPEFPVNGAECLTAELDLDAEDDDYWRPRQQAVGDITYPTVECFLMNEDLRPMFQNVFFVAEREIDLICPWLNQYVVNEELILLIHRAVSRGVTIKIIYGMGNDEDARRATTEKTVEMLKKRFSSSGRLHFCRGNTHIKYLICDDKFMMCGSYNFLSFCADYNEDDVRDEGMEYIVDKNQIAQRRRQLFSWE